MPAGGCTTQRATSQSHFGSRMRPNRTQPGWPELMANIDQRGQARFHAETGLHYFHSTLQGNRSLFQRQKEREQKALNSTCTTVSWGCSKDFQKLFFVSIYYLKTRPFPRLTIDSQALGASEGRFNRMIVSLLIKVAAPSKDCLLEYSGMGNACW